MVVSELPFAENRRSILRNHSRKPIIGCRPDTAGNHWVIAGGVGVVQKHDIGFCVRAYHAEIRRVPIERGASQIVPGTAIPNGNITPGLAISSDGRLLAFLTVEGTETPVHHIALVNLDAGQEPQRRMLDPDPRISSAPSFTLEGKAVVYPILENGADNLWLQPLNGSRSHAITNFQSDTIRSFNFSSDQGGQ